jgi:hypothetical protein
MRFLVLLCALLSLPLLAPAQTANPHDDVAPICTKNEDCRLLTFKDCCGTETGICIGPSFDSARFLKGMEKLCKATKADCSVPTKRPISCTCSGYKCVARGPVAK